MAQRYFRRPQKATGATIIAYKDKDKQREASKEAMRRHRARKQGITEDVSDTHVIPETEGITNPCVYCGKELEFAILKCCYSCALEQPSKPVSPATDGHTFADLPPDVQETINIMSRRDGKIDPLDKARRTKIAIHYRTTCFGPQGTGVA